MNSNYIAEFGGYAPGEDIPNDPGKMFIGGLSWQTTPESIREYFSKFGDLAEVMVMKDPTTRRSRGFGFITFSESESVDRVLDCGIHHVDGKIVEPKVAVPRKTNPRFVMRTKKIFVGGLSATTSLDDIRAYFDQFCKVKDAMLAYDKVTNRHRGFGFVSFDNEDVVEKICEIHFHDINGKMVESKKALPKEPRMGYYNAYTPGLNQPTFSTFAARPNGTNNYINRNVYREPFDDSYSSGGRLMRYADDLSGNNRYDIYSGENTDNRSPADSSSPNNNNNNEIPFRSPAEYYLELDAYATTTNNQQPRSGGAYEDNFPELSCKFAQFRLDGPRSGIGRGNSNNSYGY